MKPENYRARRRAMLLSFTGGLILMVIAGFSVELYHQISQKKNWIDFQAFSEAQEELQKEVHNEKSLSKYLAELNRLQAIRDSLKLTYLEAVNSHSIRATGVFSQIEALKARQEHIFSILTKMADSTIHRKAYLQLIANYRYNQDAVQELPVLVSQLTQIEGPECECDALIAAAEKEIRQFQSEKLDLKLSLNDCINNTRGSKQQQDVIRNENEGLKAEKNVLELKVKELQKRNSAFQDLLKNLDFTARRDIWLVRELDKRVDNWTRRDRTEYLNLKTKISGLVYEGKWPDDLQFKP